MDISSLLSVNSDAIKNIGMNQKTAGADESFGSIFASAMDLINETSNLQSIKNVEQMKVSMGTAENSHDLPIAAAKASTAMTYTIALRDKFIEAYKEIMQIQI